MTTTDSERYWITAVREDDGSLHALSRREEGPDGTPFAGPWRLLTEAEAIELAIAWNGDPREGGMAEATEVFRFDADPAWPDSEDESPSTAEWFAESKALGCAGTDRSTLRRVLGWATSASADAENHDQETDLDAIGSPGGASWASVAPDGRPGHKPWAWTVYRCWNDVDTTPDSELAAGEADTEDEAKEAVTDWVASHQG